MKDLTPVLFVLKKIADDKLAMPQALDKALDTYNLSSQDIKTTIADVFGILRDFPMLRAQVLDKFPSLQPDDDLTYLLMASLFELRNPQADREEVLSSLDKTVKANGLVLPEVDCKASLLSLAPEREFVPEQYKADFLSNDSLLLNCPRWVLAAYIAEYGAKEATKILLSLREAPSLYLTVNTLLRKASDFEGDSRFKVLKSLSGDYQEGASLWAVKGGRASQYEEVAKNQLFAQDYSYFRFLDALPILQYGRALHVNGGSGVTSAGLALRFLKKAGSVTVAYGDEGRFAKAKGFHSRLGLTNVEELLAEPKMIKTMKQFDSFDLVLVTPTSTHLGQTRKRPDVNVTFDPDTLNLTMAKQDDALLEGSFFPTKGGYLAYAVPSVLKEEGEDRINAFLDQRKNFALLTQKTIFPYADGDGLKSDGLYFAVLKRKD